MPKTTLTKPLFPYKGALKGIVEDCGDKDKIALKLGYSTKTLDRRLDAPWELTIGELDCICKILGLNVYKIIGIIKGDVTVGGM